MNPKKYSVLIGIIYALSIIGATMTFTVQANATDTNPNDLIPGDMGIVTVALAHDISFYYLPNSTATTVKIEPANPINTTSSSSPSKLIPIFTIPEVKIVSGTNNNALYNYFNQQMFSEYLQSRNSASSSSLVQSTTSQNPTTTQIPTIYSLSQTGFNKLGALPTLHSLLPRLRSFNPKFSSLSLESSNRNTYINDFNTFVTSTGVNESDFDATGLDSVFTQKMSTQTILDSASKSYDNLNNDNFTNSFNSSYYNYALSLGLINPDGSSTNTLIPIGNILGSTQTTKSQNFKILTSGYLNFNYQAIVLPLINYYIALYNLTDTNVLDYSIYYNGLFSVYIDQSVSTFLKSTILSNINNALSTKSGILDSLTANANEYRPSQTLTMSILGIPVSHMKVNLISDNSATSLVFGGNILNNNKPLSIDNSYLATVCGSDNITTSMTFNSTCPSTDSSTTINFPAPYTSSYMTVAYQAMQSQLQFQQIQDESANLLLSTMTTDNCYSNGWCGSIFQYPATNTVSDPNNPSQGTISPVFQSVLIPLNTSLYHSLLTFAPIAFIGIAIAAAVLIFYFRRKRQNPI